MLWSAASGISRRTFPVNWDDHRRVHAASDIGVPNIGRFNHEGTATDGRNESIARLSAGGLFCVDICGRDDWLRNTLLG